MCRQNAVRIPLCRTFPSFACGLRQLLAIEYIKSNKRTQIVNDARLWVRLLAGRRPTRYHTRARGTARPLGTQRSGVAAAITARPQDGQVRRARSRRLRAHSIGGGTVRGMHHDRFLTERFLSNILIFLGQKSNEMPTRRASVQLAAWASGRESKS